jgi:hypothetical protein
MMASRQKPESARSVIDTSGQRARICSKLRGISPSVPWPASMLERRSRAHS